MENQIADMQAEIDMHIDTISQLEDQIATLKRDLQTAESDRDAYYDMLSDIQHTIAKF